MLVSQAGGHPATVSAIEEPDLDEKGFVDFFNSIGFFCERSGQRIQTDGAALIFLDDREQQLATNRVKAMFIYLEHLERGLRGGDLNFPGATDLGVVANAAQQAIGNARGAAGTGSDFEIGRASC